MKKTYFLACVILFTATGLMAQPPNSEIYVFDFKIWLDQYSLSNPMNVTSNPGFYDNQPYFTPNGDGFLYVSADESGKTDVYLFDLIGNERRRLTYTPEVSEFSPTIMPDKKQFSVVILEDNGTQKLWKYFVDAPIAKQVLSIDKVGYHAWIDENQLALFIVGNNDNTLNIVNADGSGRKEVAHKIGPSIHKIPGENKVSFLDMSSRKTMIKSYDLASGAIEDIVEGQPNSQHYTWTPNGLILMGDGKKLYKFDPKHDTSWIELADLSAYGLHAFNRLVVNHDITKLAVVVQE